VRTRIENFPLNDNEIEKKERSGIKELGKYKTYSSLLTDLCIRLIKAVASISIIPSTSLPDFA